MTSSPKNSENSKDSFLVALVRSSIILSSLDRLLNIYTPSCKMDFSASSLRDITAAGSRLSPNAIPKPNLPLMRGNSDTVRAAE